MVRIRTVRPLNGFRVRLGFTDGTESELDLTPYLRGPIFEPLRTSHEAFARVSVDAQLGTIVWPNGADIDPDVLYEAAHRGPT
ncbi:MAG: DUF2442 domain-containing protein [Deltaproteobacteria bacterium]|nr:DUF2442 domain-containing protein [Deltaproteobacteria bacterium]